jgi:hypothetical protein
MAHLFAVALLVASAGADPTAAAFSYRPSADVFAAAAARAAAEGSGGSSSLELLAARVQHAVANPPKLYR